MLHVYRLPVLSASWNTKRDVLPTAPRELATQVNACVKGQLVYSTTRPGTHQELVPEFTVPSAIKFKAAYDMARICTSKMPHNQDGPWAWLVCFSAMMSWTAAVGFVFSFGIFFPVFMEYFNEDRERTAWIGSLAIALLFFTGSISGLLVSKFGCRVTSLLGAMICAASLAMASLSKNIVTLYVLYSILFGIGTSFIFNTGLVIVSSYFTKRRSLALGFVSAGQGLGVLIQGPLLQTLVDNYGWKITYRIMAGVMFGICLLGVTYDPNVKTEGHLENVDQLTSNDEPRQGRQGRRRVFLDLSVWKVPAYVVITFSCAIAEFGHLFHKFTCYNDMIVFAVFYGFLRWMFHHHLKHNPHDVCRRSEEAGRSGLEYAILVYLFGQRSTYCSAFYLAGSTVMLGAAIPFILLFINRERAHHGDEQDQALHPRPSKRQTAKSDSQESELPFYDNPSFVGNLGTT
ncbi:hypothetical protein OS493_021672 [Desmophyllum pertusum]|uniref:Major facilitator superfamily (MFS) profile domain-containing protein n=1 Tax=Desmophyllum pertusum TaxID=174260 RepID=A0A9X0CG42_9CNID|nr:hypothetical protein OS493_021672 [Desmophyllum pertusum]